MTSVSSSYSNKQRLDHTIHAVVSDNLPPITYTRTVSAGQPTCGKFKVDSYSTVDARGIHIPTQRVNSYQEYIAGCTIHDGYNCLGHMCTTPKGTVLLPQKLASTLGVMSNDYAKMAESLFTRDGTSQELQYREKFRSLMLGKSGKMRGDMPSGPVDSSGREVISLEWKLEVMSMEDKEETLYFAVPRMVAKNMRVLRTPVDEKTGIPLGHYVEDCLREGDWIVVVRPPSLWAGNVQPMKVVLWDHECFGLMPSLADDFHADHDGDEMQIYFIGGSDAIEECKKWRRLSTNKFRKAIEEIQLPECAYNGDMNLITKFMVHSTISIKELMEGKELPELAKPARVKEAMADMLVDRFRNPEKVFAGFVAESIRGIKDVMSQQLDQGLIGDMSRQAKISASCIQYRGNGIFHIRIGSETITSINTDISHITTDIKYPLGGNACMRLVSAICGMAQQAKLDAHRVSQAVSSKLDLVNNFITGGKESLVVLKSGSLPPHSWKLVDGNITFCIVDNNMVRSHAKSIIAAYNPAILRFVELVGGNIKEVCRNGILVVCTYHNIVPTKLELYALAELLCYRPHADPLNNQPITTKVGMIKRDMRWMSTIFANHFGVLKSIQQKGTTRKRVRPETITEASSFCNFDYI